MDGWMVVVINHIRCCSNLPLTVYEMGSSGSRESTCVRSTQRHTQIPSMSTQTLQPHCNKQSEQNVRSFFFPRLTSLHDLIPAVTSLMGWLNVSQRLLLFFAMFMLALLQLNVRLQLS